MEDLIKLQNAHVTQHTDETGRSDWRVEANVTDELLHELPAHIKDADMFTILEFARKFELEALQAGIEFQKKHALFTHNQERDKLHEVIKGLEVANGKLAAKVHKFLEEV